MPASSSGPVECQRLQYVHLHSRLHRSSERSAGVFGHVRLRPMPNWPFLHLVRARELRLAHGAVARHHCWLGIALVGVVTSAPQRSDSSISIPHTGGAKRAQFARRRTKAYLAVSLLVMAIVVLGWGGFQLASRSGAFGRQLGAVEIISSRVHLRARRHQDSRLLHIGLDSPRGKYTLYRVDDTGREIELLRLTSLFADQIDGGALVETGDSNFIFYVADQFAVSLDAARSWRVWSIPPIRFEGSKITGVTIGSAGTGTMTIMRRHTKLPVISTWTTTDFGVHWSAPEAAPKAARDR